MAHRSLTTSIVYSSMYLVRYDLENVSISITVAVLTKTEPKVLHFKHTHVLFIPLQHSQEYWYFSPRAFEYSGNLHTASHA